MGATHSDVPDTQIGVQNRSGALFFVSVNVRLPRLVPNELLVVTDAAGGERDNFLRHDIVYLPHHDTVT